MLTDFQNSFTVRFTGKFATKSSLTIKPHLNCVTALLCEISLFKKLQCSRPECMKNSCKTQLLKTLLKIPYSDFSI